MSEAPNNPVQTPHPAGPPSIEPSSPLPGGHAPSPGATASDMTSVDTGMPVAEPSVPLAAPEAGAPLLEPIAQHAPPPPPDALLPEADAEAEEEEDDEEEVTTGAGPIELAAPDPTDIPKEWYILKVQSNRENSIADTLRRRVKIAGLEEFFDEIIVPTEDIAEYRDGKRKITKRKIYPGYIVVHMSITDETWFLVRDTPGVGDFTGAGGKPTPMLQREVERILPKPAVKPGDMVKTTIPFKPGDRVRIKDGTFENFEGDVHAIDEANGRVTVMINIFGRSTPTELEHWQIEEV